LIAHVYIMKPTLLRHEQAAQRRYLLVTPCRDEAAYLRSTICSVVSQTIRPSQWVIVDDGSSDSTPQILEEAARKHSFIHVVRRVHRGGRNVGAGVVDAFDAGLATVNLDDYDYVCKLDADLEFGPLYFERLMRAFEADPWLGTMSGKTFLRDESGEREERIGDENSHGAAKFYRTECFRDIGGFIPHLGWDAIDGHMCRMKGWKATSIHDPDLKIIHLRRMGSSQINFWIGRLRWGRLKHFIGSAWYYVFVSSVYRSFERPYLMSGAGIIAGYLQAALRGDEKFEDLECRRFIRRFERESILRGRNRVLEVYHFRVEREHPERAVSRTHSTSWHLSAPSTQTTITS
jgi:poly-beta-1,6-N-acetyl-D-glucosamine synthase